MLPRQTISSFIFGDFTDYFLISPIIFFCVAIGFSDDFISSAKN